MNNCIKLTIPCKPIVKAYLEYNLQFDNVIKETNRTHKFLLYLMEKSYREHDKFIEERNKSEYQESVDIYMTHRLIRKYGLDLTKTGLMHLNVFITEQVYSLLFIWIDAYRVLNANKIKSAIYSFCEKYGFNIDLFKYETIKKAYYRYEKDEKLKLKYF